jgi:hypothetical protein
MTQEVSVKGRLTVDVDRDLDAFDGDVNVRER